MTENERMTHRRASGIKTGYWSPNKKEELVQRLAAYEDTGLEPQEIQVLADLHDALRDLAAKAHAALDALPAADRADDRTILTDLARNVISSARLYGVDSELSPSRKKPSQEKHPQT